MVGCESPIHVLIFEKKGGVLGADAFKNDPPFSSKPTVHCTAVPVLRTSSSTTAVVGTVSILNLAIPKFR